MKNQYLTANYHAHTSRCQHARGTERDYIEAAIASGIQIFGFTDHVPCPFSDGFVSKIRMRMEEANDYIETLRALKAEYADRIQILIGFETEYLPEYFHTQMSYLDAIGFDYMIMGQHFLTSEATGPYTGTRTESEAFLTAYTERVIEGMQTGRFAYLAHPDLIRYEGSPAIYASKMRSMCEVLKEMHIPLELNLLGILSQKHYPREAFWEIAGSVGNDVILGIDAHWPEQIGDMDTYHKALTIADKYHLHLIDKLDL